MNSLINKRVSLLLMFFFILSLLFPATVFNKVIFIIILGFVVVNYKLYKLNTVSPFVVFFIFLYGFIFSFFNSVDKELALQFFLSVLVLFLIYPIVKYKIDIDRITKMSGIIMAIYTWIAFLIITVYVDLPFSLSFNEIIFVKYSSGSNGLRDFVEEGTMSFHIGTLPFMYLSFVLFVDSFIEKKRIISFLAIIFLFWTILISASRGTILSCILVAGFVVFYRSKLTAKLAFLALSIPTIIGTVIYILTNTTVFDSGETSNTTKVGHFVSFLDHINFFNLFLGEGLGAYYYSKGVQKAMAHTEITPLDMLRYFGFILTPILYFYIFFPSKKLSDYLGRNKIYFVIFLIYVVNSFTNPTMFNSYGLLIVLWYWYKILNNSNGKDEVPLI